MKKILGISIVLWLFPFACAPNELRFSEREDDGAASGGSDGGPQTGGEGNGVSPTGGGPSGGRPGIAIGGGSGAYGGVEMGGYGGEGVVTPESVMIHDGDSRITAVDVNSTHVYWLQYGTQDEFDNYLQDGKLLRRSISGGPIELVQEDLPGPRTLVVSEDDAYIHLDESTMTTPTPRDEVWHIDLETKVTTLVAAGGMSSSEMTVLGTEAYWLKAGSVVYSLDGPAMQELYGEVSYGYGIEADATSLYVLAQRGIAGGEQGIYKSLKDGSAPAWLSPIEELSIESSGDYLYSVGGYAGQVAELPKTGERGWKNVAVLPHNLMEIEVHDDHYVARWRVSGDPKGGLSFGILGQAGSQELVLHSTGSRFRWSSAPDRVFWTGGNRFYEVMLPE